ncbi:MAG: pentapeptide repeat-containing protein [Chloroflexi bacterium]|nr:pentapeptide repeat-containing protein [Chloroflexota bacterium]
MASIKSFVDRRGKRFWWTVRFVLVTLIAFAILLLGWIGGMDYVTNIYTELIGVILSTGVTVVIVDQFYERRDKERLKHQLVREAGSSINAVAINAIEQLRLNGWLIGEEGLLRGAQLRDADLRGANLKEVNLQGASLWNAKLDEADCYNANLQYAFLHNASLQKAKLNGANLQESMLMGSNLREALLFHANMQGAFLDRANLAGADLRGVNLLGARLDFATFQDAILTDATLPDDSNYKEGMDIGRFTMLRHPEFMATRDALEAIREKLGISFHRHFA